MSESPLVPLRLPRGRHDPITDALTALGLLAACVARPWRTETILVPLDSHHRGHVILVVDGTDDLELVLDRTLPVLLDVPNPPAAVLAATVSLPVDAGPRVGADRPSGEHWVDRWLAAADTADRAGCPLREWFVLGPHGPWCPRDVLGAAPRWP